MLMQGMSAVETAKLLRLSWNRGDESLKGNVSAYRLSDRPTVTRGTLKDYQLRKQLNFTYRQ